MKNIVLAAAAAAAFTLTATPVAAQERYEVRIVYGDLDLSTQAGADRMFARIESAARNTCAVGGVTRRARTEERACMTDFTRRALAELNRAAPQRAYARNENAAITVASR